MSERVVMRVRLGQVANLCCERDWGIPICEQVNSDLSTSSALERIVRSSLITNSARSGILSRARALRESERAATRFGTPALSEGGDSSRTCRSAAQQCQGATNGTCSPRAVGTASCSLQVGSKS
jgi:hypothetical protein